MVFPIIQWNCDYCHSLFVPSAHQRSKRKTGKTKYSFCSKRCANAGLGKAKFGYTSLNDRFWAKVKIGKPDECWEWRGSRDKKEYGRININRFPELAHRVAWELTNGQIPAGLNVLHQCDNPPCCNPAHHFLGTYKDNCDDMWAKGRQSKRYWKPLCHNGHSMIPVNYRMEGGSRRCLLCKAEYDRAYRATKKKAV